MIDFTSVPKPPQLHVLLNFMVDPVDGLDPARRWMRGLERPFLRLLAQSSAYQLSSRVSGDFSEGAVPLFARHYARRMEGEEVHDAIAKATGVLGSYIVTGWTDRVNWAVQLPEPTEPASDANTANFINDFLRGNRDTLDRSQAGSIQQELALMNDAFVINRVKVKSPKLAFIAQIASNEDAIAQLLPMCASFYKMNIDRSFQEAAGPCSMNRRSAPGLYGSGSWGCRWRTENW